MGQYLLILSPWLTIFLYLLSIIVVIFISCQLYHHVEVKSIVKYKPFKILNMYIQQQNFFLIKKVYVPLNFRTIFCCCCFWLSYYLLFLKDSKHLLLLLWLFSYFCLNLKLISLLLVTIIFFSKHTFLSYVSCSDWILVLNWKNNLSYDTLKKNI